MVQKKLPWKLYIVYTVLAGYVGYFIGGAYVKGDNFFTLYEKLMININYPFANYWNKNSIFWILGAILIYGFVLMISILSQKNYMFGKEYGTSKFANPEMINRELADHDDDREDNIVVGKRRRRRDIWRRRK